MADRLEVVYVPLAIHQAVMGEPIGEWIRADWLLTDPLAEVGEPYFDQSFFGVPEVRCAVVKGTDAELLRPILEQAIDHTLWVSDGDEFVVGARPLLPDENGCPRER